jgi:hypothetical protein
VISLFDHMKLQDLGILKQDRSISVEGLEHVFPFFLEKPVAKLCFGLFVSDQTISEIHVN